MTPSDEHHDHADDLDEPLSPGDDAERLADRDRLRRLAANRRVSPRMITTVIVLVILLFFVFTSVVNFESDVPEASQGAIRPIVTDDVPRTADPIPIPSDIEDQESLDDWDFVRPTGWDDAFTYRVGLDAMFADDVRVVVDRYADDAMISVDRMGRRSAQLTIADHGSVTALALQDPPRVEPVFYARAEVLLVEGDPETSFCGLAFDWNFGEDDLDAATWFMVKVSGSFAEVSKTTIGEDGDVHQIPTHRWSEGVRSNRRAVVEVYSDEFGWRAAVNGRWMADVLEPIDGSGMVSPVAQALERGSERVTCQFEDFTLETPGGQFVTQ